MMRFLLDTDHVSLLGGRHPATNIRVGATPRDEIGVSIITVQEVLSGWLAVLARQLDSLQRLQAYANLLAAVQFFATMNLVPFDEAAERLYQELRALRLSVGRHDLMIAATALSRDVIVATRNARDFGRIPGLRLEDWSVA